MSDAIFPALPGLTWNIQRTPVWSSINQRGVSLMETNVALASYPLYQITLTYAYLWSTAAKAQLQTLVGFFNARNGAADTFLYTMPDDSSVTAQQFGTGDGSTKGFQLVRTFGSFDEPVKDVNGTPSVYVGGVLKTAGTDYTLSATGKVTFTSAPANAAALTWTGSYYWRCRFMQDSTDFNKFLRDLYEAKKVEMVTAKQ